MDFENRLLEDFKSSKWKRSYKRLKMFSITIKKMITAIYVRKDVYSFSIHADNMSNECIFSWDNYETKNTEDLLLESKLIPYGRDIEDLLKDAKDVGIKLKNVIYLDEEVRPDEDYVRINFKPFIFSSKASYLDLFWNSDNSENSLCDYYLEFVDVPEEYMVGDNFYPSSPLDIVPDHNVDLLIDLDFKANELKYKSEWDKNE